MAVEETKEIKTAQIESSKIGARLFRNNRGMFYTESGQKTRAGIEADGSSDLIGFVPVLITPEMVGKTVAVFVAAEGKKRGWKGVKTETEKQQLKFISAVNNNGGIAFFFDNGEKVAGLIQKVIDALKRIA